MPVQSRAAPPTVGWCRDGVRLILLCSLLFGLGLGRYPLINPDEGRYAEIPREMRAAGDFVTPRLNGVKYFEKPPLAYWLVAGSLKVLGPGEAAARAVPALFGALGVMLLYAVVRHAHGRDAAWWASVVLATSLLYFIHARILLIDMVVSVFISAALFCFFLGIREPAGARRRLLFYGLYASAALATLAKGLIGFLLPGAVMFLWLLLFHQWRRLRPLFLPTGLLLFALIAVPWHALVAGRNPGWARFYFLHEHWLRFTTATHGHDEPWWFFLPFILVGLFPWTGFLPRGLARAVRGGWRQRTILADDWFPLIWAGFILLFFSASQSKLVPYVLPVFPALAWLIGRVVAELRAQAQPAPWRAPLCTAVGMTGLLGAAAAFAMIKPGVIKSVEQLAQLRPQAWPAACALLIGATAGGWLLHRDQPQRALAAILGACGVFYGTLILASPAIARPGTKGLAAIVTRDAGPADIVLHYHEFFHDFTYYARRTVGIVAVTGELTMSLDPEAQRSGRFITDADFKNLWTGPRPAYVVMRRRELPALQAQPWFRARVLGEEPNHVLLSNQH